MNILKNVLLTIVSLLVLLLIISFFLPSKFHTERSAYMKAKPEQVYKLIGNFKNWDQWSPWHKMDPAAEKSYNNIEEGRGATYAWKSKVSEVGTGKLTIIEAVPDRKIQTEMEFEGMGLSNASFMIEPNDTGLKLTWSMDTEGKGLPFWKKPVAKYMNLMMDKFLGPSYEQGLANIKEIVEKTPVLTISGFDAEVKDWPTIYYIGIRSKLTVVEMPQKFGEYVAQMIAEIKGQGAEQAGNPFSINYSASGNLHDIEFCLPVKMPMHDNGMIKSGNKISTKALVIKHYGNYGNIGKIYQQGFEYLSQNNLNASGAPMEFYVTDPMMEKDTAKWLTEVVLPCQ